MKNKKTIREHFRKVCMQRDSFRCVICLCIAPKNTKPEDYFDVHHITDRHEMPNGGYILENGITLCPDCHSKAENYHALGKAIPGYSSEELYKIIGSSKEKAIKVASEGL